MSDRDLTNTLPDGIYEACPCKGKGLCTECWDTGLRPHACVEVGGGDAGGVVPHSGPPADAQVAVDLSATFCPGCVQTPGNCICFDPPEPVTIGEKPRRCVSCGRPTRDGLRWCSTGCMDEVPE